MSYLQNLLMQTEPLLPGELTDLREWLETLEADIAIFGPTTTDLNRTHAIKRKLKKELR